MNNSIYLARIFNNDNDESTGSKYASNQYLFQVKAASQKKKMRNEESLENETEARNMYNFLGRKDGNLEDEVVRMRRSWK